MMNEPIDWVELDRKIRERSRQSALPGMKIYTSSQAMVGLELIIGEDRIREAVDYYVAYKPEAELARNVLWRLQPWSAMQRCYEIYKTSTNIDERIAAVDLLRVAADGRALEWIEEFLADPDESIQSCGIGVLDQLVFGGGIRNSEAAMEKVETLLALAEQHKDWYVRQQAASIRASLAMSEANEKLWAEITERNRQGTL